MNERVNEYLQRMTGEGRLAVPTIDWGTVARQTGRAVRILGFAGGAAILAACTATAQEQPQQVRTQPAAIPAKEDDKPEVRDTRDTRSARASSLPQDTERESRQAVQPTRVPTAEPARVTATLTPRVEQEVTSANVKIPRPKDFRPEVSGGVQNQLLDKAPKGRWFHPMTKVRFLRDQEHVWSYQYYFADFTDMDLTQHAGEEGRLVFRQDSGPSRFTLGVGILDEFVDNQGVKHDLRGDIRTGFRPDVVPSIWVRTHPDVVFRVFDPDTGQPLIMDGKPVEGVTSESGDIGFGLGDCGRIVMAAEIPFDPGLETFVWKGPHDRDHLDLNWIDVRSALRCDRGPGVSAPAPTARPVK